MKKFFKKDERGFTLAELLIVVAIIGVLVAVSIPIFTTQLEKSREAVDLANARAAYAEVMTSALSGTASSDSCTETNGVWTATGTCIQQVDGWTTTMTGVTIGGVTPTGSPSASGTYTVTYTPGTGDNAGIVTVVFA